MVADYLVAELIKLARRPASWILGVIVMASLLMFGYFFPYVTAISTQGATQGVDVPQEANIGAVLQPLLPENVLSLLLSNITSFTAGVALIFGALVIGSEYSWGTLKLMISQRSGKLNLLSGKILSIAILLASSLLVMLLLSVICSALIARLQEQPADWPPLWQMVKGLGAGWVILAAWASLGVFLGVLFRGASPAIGVGLVYALVVEGLILSLPTRSDAFTLIQQAFLGRNVRDLVSYFDQSRQGPVPGDTVDPAQAVFVLLAYTVVFLLLTVLLFRRRDV